MDESTSQLNGVKSTVGGMLRPPCSSEVFVLVLCVGGDAQPVENFVHLAHYVADVLSEHRYLDPEAADLVLQPVYPLDLLVGHGCSGGLQALDVGDGPVAESAEAYDLLLELLPLGVVVVQGSLYDAVLGLGYPGADLLQVLLQDADVVGFLEGCGLGLRGGAVGDVPVLGLVLHPDPVVPADWLEGGPYGVDSGVEVPADKRHFQAALDERILDLLPAGGVLLDEFIDLLQAFLVLGVRGVDLLFLFGQPVDFPCHETYLSVVFASRHCYLCACMDYFLIKDCTTVS